MGCRNRELSDDDVAASLNEALLFTTMCIIGLPVDVHVKDGSVYSGIFHTACLEQGYGVVLKKAKRTKKGKQNANVTSGGLIDTLVILSGDLVEVVAKGVLLPADGLGNVAANNDAAAFGGTVLSSVCLKGDTKTITSPFSDEKKMDQTRQVGDGWSQGECNDNKQKFEIHKEETVYDLGGSSLSSDACLDQVKSGEEVHFKMTSKVLSDGTFCDDLAPSLIQPDNQCCSRSTSSEVPSSDAMSSGVLNSFNSDVNDMSETHVNALATPTGVAPSQSSASNRTTKIKEFKLNPGAKIFSPSFTNPRPATPPAVPTVAYMPNNSPLVSVAAAQPEIEISTHAPCSSLPVKFIPYGNLMAGHGGSGSQYSQSAVGHLGSRAQPVRYAGQYLPVQAGPAYLHSNPQAVMVGRLGQLVYVHPVSQEIGQSAAAISPVSARPLLSQHQVQFPKHQGNAATPGLQLCVPRPFMNSGQQPLAVPTHIPLLQPPFPVNRTIPVPGSNGVFSSKFP